VKLIHVLGALPFLGILGGIIFANRIEPFVLGLPFVLFWTVTWVVLTSVIMAVVYVLDPANGGEQLRNQVGRAAGILVGVAVVTYLTVMGLTLRTVFPSLGSIGDINVGVIALLAKVVVLFAVSLATRTTMTTDKARASPDPALKPSRRGRS
jgi:hypothetical protein